MEKECYPTRMMALNFVVLNGKGVELFLKILKAMKGPGINEKWEFVEHLRTQFKLFKLCVIFLNNDIITQSMAWHKTEMERSSGHRTLWKSSFAFYKEYLGILHPRHIIQSFFWLAPP